MGTVKVEICCGSAEDVYAAAAAGADRVELNSALSLGGLTPSLGAMALSRRAGIEIMAMARPREGGFCYSEMEFETLCADARALLEAGADGVVFACQHPDGTVDAQRCRAVLEIIGDRQSVFSRAIDTVPDWRGALDTLCALGFTRVLTSGQAPTAPEGADTIRRMREYAAGRLEILPGCGVRPENAAELLARTGCGQLHASVKGERPDGSAAHRGAVRFTGAAPGGGCWAVDRAALAALVAAVRK